jgi:hypothetical protein
MKHRFFYLFLALSFSATGDTSESISCCIKKLNSECCNGSNHNDKPQIENSIQIHNFNIRLQSHIDDFESHEDEIRASVKSIELSQGVIESRTSELKDSMWNTINWMSTIFYGTIGLGFAGGGIFIWRENTISKARIEKEMMNIKRLKEEAENQLQETLDIIKSNDIKIKEELSCLRKRFEIDRLMDANVDDFDRFFPLITYISQFPSLENLVSLKKLEKYSHITVDERKQIERFTSDLKESVDINA